MTTMEPTPSADLYRSQRTMILVRWVAVPWALLQVLSFQGPYPEGYRALALLLVAILAVGNGLIWALHRGSQTRTSARRLAVGGLALDVGLLSAFVWLYAFDYNTAIWAIVFIAPLEGALLFQLPGALATWATVTAVYAARDVWAAEEFGHPLLWQSITFRMGIVGIVALVAGLMARDLIRERTKLETALSEIQRIDRLRSGLISTLGHDVRSPLTVIRGAVETIMKRSGRISADDQKRLLEAAHRQAERLERLADDLLDLARLDEGRLELDIKAVVINELVQRALSYVDGGEQISASIEEDVLVAADPARLEQVIVNLANNALYHGAPPISITAEPRNGEVVLEVSDHGEGIAPADVDHIFEPFAQSKKKPGSAGYGLAIVKALVEAQNGEVSYATNEHGGASFRVTLPRP